jgi:hypothetical protein
VNLRYYAGIRLEGLTRTTEILNQNSRSPPPIFESGTSRIRSRTVNHSTTNFDDSEMGMCFHCRGGGSEWYKGLAILQITM